MRKNRFSKNNDRNQRYMINSQGQLVVYTAYIRDGIWNFNMANRVDLKPYLFLMKVNSRIKALMQGLLTEPQPEIQKCKDNNLEDLRESLIGREESEVLSHSCQLHQEQELDHTVRYQPMPEIKQR